MTTTDETLKADHYRTLDARIAPSIDPSAPADVACFMTTDTVDADNEIMLPGGADLSRFEKNPILLLCHGFGQPGSYYPLTIGKVLGTKRRPNGIMAQVKFAQSSEMGREVKGLFDEGMLRSFSIGFRSLEASPLTREEAASRPDWQAAYERARGKILVHRKWLLLELSVTPLPANPDALITTYKSRGIDPPSWLQLEKPTMADATETTDKDVIGGDETTTDDETLETKAACTCGKADCPKCSPQTKDDEPDDDDTDDNGESEEGAGFVRGDHVRVKAPHYKGFGEVQGVYRKGHVPHVDQDVMGSADRPAARVKCYKAMGDGYVPTKDHVGVHCKHLSKMAEPMQMPSRKFAPPPETKAARTPATDGPLPPLVAKSDEELQQEAFEALAMLPQLVDKAVDKAVARYTGAV